MRTVDHAGRVQTNTQMWLHILRGASRIQGPRGRALDADIPALGLKKHDRLEPWTGLQDIGDEFDQLQPTGGTSLVRVCFWRRSEETATRHRSPLLDTVLHTSVNSLTIDILPHVVPWNSPKVSRLGLVQNARG